MEVKLNSMMPIINHEYFDVYWKWGHIMLDNIREGKWEGMGLGLCPPMIII